MTHLHQPIAVMDSGLGGLSVLTELKALLPAEDYLYFGDNAHAPYGEKKPAEVRSLTFAVVEEMLQADPKAIVVACNTATSAAIIPLREAYPHLPIIGLEPALKPAVTQHPGGRILVMATPLTLKEEKFARLLSQYQDQAEILPLPCPGLAEYIEQGHLDDQVLDDYLAQRLSFDAMPDAVVLGCTHYPLIIPALRKQLGEKPSLYQGGKGAAKETKRRLQEGGKLRSTDGKGQIKLVSSGEKTQLFALASRLGLID